MTIEQHQQIQPTITRPEINPAILAARGRDYSIKLFYAAMRLAHEEGKEIIDIGSSVAVDPSEMPHTHAVIESAHQESLRRGHYTEYASSYGTSELRNAISRYFKRWGNVDIDPNPEVMVTRGIIDSYDRVLQALDITHVIVPSWAPYYARSHALINGKVIVDVTIEMQSGNLNLQILEHHLQEQGVQPGKALFYITHPSAPLGTVMEDIFIEETLIPFVVRKGLALFSDSYIEHTRFDEKAPLRPILSYKGAREVAVEAVTVSKELGLPGARAGGIAGNRDIINAVRLLAAAKVDIVSGSSQVLAARALDEIAASTAGERIKKELEEEILPRFQAMEWPVIKPAAGIDMLIAVPRGFIRDDIENPSLLAAFSLLRRFGVALCPCSTLGTEGKYVLRLVLKQEGGKIPLALDTLQTKGFEWANDKPTDEDVKYLQQLMSTLDLTRL